MATNCSACNDLRENAADFLVNGVTDTACTSLKNDTGFNPSSNTNDCDDLNDANDCLIGNMTDEIEAYDICDWKTFMKKYIPNTYNVIKSIICAVCGLWTHIHDLITNVNRHECEIKQLYNGATFNFGEDQEGASKLVAGAGVSFKIRSNTSGHSSDVYIQYIAGGLARIGGSLNTFTEAFHETDGTARSGNSVWDWNHTILNGGELLYEIRIKKSEYPQLKRMYGGYVNNAGGGDITYRAHSYYFDEGTWAYGQHGWCEDDDGSPSGEGHSAGHKVPAGWAYVQVRMHWDGNMYTYDVKDGRGDNKNGTSFTPYGWMGVRMNRNEAEC